MTFSVLLYVREHHESVFTALMLRTPTLHGLLKAVSYHVTDRDLIHCELIYLKTHQNLVTLYNALPNFVFDRDFFHWVFRLRKNTTFLLKISKSHTSAQRRGKHNTYLLNILLFNMINAKSVLSHEAGVLIVFHYLISELSSKWMTTLCVTILTNQHSSSKWTKLGTVKTSKSFWRRSRRCRPVDRMFVNYKWKCSFSQYGG